MIALALLTLTLIAGQGDLAQRGPQPLAPRYALSQGADVLATLPTKWACEGLIHSARAGRFPQWQGRPVKSEALRCVEVDR